ncbi:hypothetical protein [Rosistilla oblonga]|uniref:hypothetical protein n=1 Tax=Rosistilla oblonga TaxID=2527990 RepID=UPI0011A02F50|nr:hypothetical protein [Rosistilla oblonga]
MRPLQSAGQLALKTCQPPLGMTQRGGFVVPVAGFPAVKLGRIVAFEPNSGENVAYDLALTVVAIRIHQYQNPLNGGLPFRLSSFLGLP